MVLLIITIFSMKVNDHKTQGKSGIYPGNKIIEHKTQSE